MNSTRPIGCWGLSLLFSVLLGLEPGRGAEAETIVTRGLPSVECSAAGRTAQLQLEVGSDGRLALSTEGRECRLPSEQARAFVAAVAKSERWIERTKSAEFSFERKAGAFGGAVPGQGLELSVRRAAEIRLRLVLRGGGSAETETQLEFTAAQVIGLRQILAGAEEQIGLARADAYKADRWMDATPTEAPTRAEPDFSVPTEVSALPKVSSAVQAPEVWHTPKPGYPFQARKLKLAGQGSILVRTDGNGRVVVARMVRNIHPLLDSTVESFARAAWKGPPNSAKTVPVTFAALD